MASAAGLIGDIGSTNARFALVDQQGQMRAIRLYALDEHVSLADAIEAYLRGDNGSERPREAVLAVASPIVGDQVSLTNHAWTFSIAQLRRQLRLERLRVINDFTANALAIPHLAPGDRVQIGPGAPAGDAPAGVIGPGTGLGVSALIPAHDGPVPVAGEGGHITMAAMTEREAAVLALMRKRFDHVSAERVLSGPGLSNLYAALCELAGLPAAAFAPAQITSPRIWDEDVRAQEATAMFCAMLGAVAGDLALMFGARAGIYIAGGIVPKIMSYFERSEFRERFEAKGRFRPYMTNIPTYVIVRPFPGLLGAAALLNEPQRDCVSPGHANP